MPAKSYDETSSRTVKLRFRHHALPPPQCVAAPLPSCDAVGTHCQRLHVGIFVPVSCMQFKPMHAALLCAQPFRERVGSICLSYLGYLCVAT
eukprot:6185346-Pleurochrysis_carterae.AAC.1